MCGYEIVGTMLFSGLIALSQGGPSVPWSRCFSPVHYMSSLDTKSFSCQPAAHSGASSQQQPGFNQETQGPVQPLTSKPQARGVCFLCLRFLTKSESNVTLLTSFLRCYRDEYSMWTFCEIKMLHKRQHTSIILIIILGHDISVEQNAHFFVLTSLL